MANSRKTERKLTVPCCYQGGKQRIAAQVVDHMLAATQVTQSTQFYDLCCGSGAITIELLHRGVSAKQITMADISSWGAVWSAIGDGTFDLDVLRGYLNRVPTNKSEIHSFATALANEDASVDECYKYLVLQACSFGGKQIWREGDSWRNAFFRRYWLPTPTSVRRSPANPMQPCPDELLERVRALCIAGAGLNCIHGDVFGVLESEIPSDSIVYIDPPYDNTTGYGFGFDLLALVRSLERKGLENIFVSEGVPMSTRAVQLNFGGPKGGISGCKQKKHEEWINAFGCA